MGYWFRKLVGLQLGNSPYALPDSSLSSKWTNENALTFFWKKNLEIRMCMLSCFSHVQLFATPWTVAHQAPLSMVFPRQEYWSGLPFPSPGDLPNPWIKPASLKSPALAGRFFTTRATWEGPKKHFCREKNKVIQKLKIFTYPLAVCIPMFIAALFTIAETWKQPKCPLMDD